MKIDVCPEDDLQTFYSFETDSRRIEPKLIHSNLTEPDVELMNYIAWKVRRLAWALNVPFDAGRNASQGQNLQCDVRDYATIQVMSVQVSFSSVLLAWNRQRRFFFKYTDALFERKRVWINKLACMDISTEIFESRYCVWSQCRNERSSVFSFIGARVSMLQYCMI